MMGERREGGFTLIELLVTVALFSVVSIGFYSVMFSSVEGSDTSEEAVRISEEARAGFNRMIRDAREAQDITATSGDSFTVETDFNDDGIIEDPNVPNPDGDFENLTFTCVGCDPGPGHIELNGEILLDGVRAVAGADVFTFSSNLLEYDTNDDGVAECTEVDVASPAFGVGNNNGECDAGEHEFLSNIDFAFTVESGDSLTSFVAQAQLRNNRR